MKSVLNGKRNYAVVLIDNEIVYKGTLKDMYPTSCMLRDLLRYQWCYFTYKKDFENAIKEHNSAPTIDIDKKRATELIASAMVNCIAKEI